MSDGIKQAQELLLRVGRECSKVGLRLNGPKTKYLVYKIDQHALQTLDGTTLEVQDDFKYLGSWVDGAEKDINVRKALAWRSFNSMNTI